MFLNYGRKLQFLEKPTNSMKGPTQDVNPGFPFCEHFSWDDATEVHILRDKSLQANLSSTRQFSEELES
ncbi:hypothetical protein CHARACLAT_012081 [Characodon lateralis]|uniref:Uncharacterized protein n=1 Tax=Characodon lateralis TaxID=208331 RepID=A0ABU7EIE0_9TELE|nr:hypothetical protein [Characodon lateralis]